ncbi:hypothetical protein [Streptomyces sp. NPDC001340]
MSVDQQRQLFRRWTTGTDAHPHEALLGILALLHAASSREVRLLRVDGLDPSTRTIRLGKRPHLSPWTRPAGPCCRGAWPTARPRTPTTPT